MKTLVISPNYPWPATKGERIRTATVMELLNQEGVQIDLICLDLRNLLIDDVEKPGNILNQLYLFPRNKLTVFAFIKALVRKRSLTSTSFYNAKFYQKVRELINQDYQQIVIFSSAFDYLIPLLKKQKSKKIFWDLIDIDSYKWSLYQKKSSFIKSIIYGREAKLIKQAEEDIIKVADKVSVISQQEKSRVRLGQHKLFVFPNHLEVQVAAKAEFPLGARKMIFVGQMDYFPNIEAVRFVSKEILPSLQAEDSSWEVTVVGRNPSTALIKELDNLNFTEEVPSITPYWQEAEIALIPLFTAMGQANKVLEAFSWGVPVITTQQVADCFSLQHNSQVLIANTQAAMIQEIKRLSSSAELGNNLIKQAKEYLIKFHSKGGVSRIIKASLKS